MKRFIGQVVEIATGAAVLSRADVLGKRNAKRYGLDLPLGGAWSGRPAVYLLRTADQPVSARARRDLMADDLARIMWRTREIAGVSEEALGRNLRQFDDYAVFVNAALSLWLCEERTGVPNAEDPNGDSIVCKKQVQVEHADALWARHLRLRALADEPKSSLTDIARLEQELWRLTLYPRESSRYGEIWHFLEYAAEKLGVRDVRMHIQEGLRLRSAMLEEQRSRREQWFGALLSVLLGIGASETLTDRFLVPILWRRGFDFTGNTFWVDVASLVSLGVAAGLVWWFTVRRKLRV